MATETFVDWAGQRIKYRIVPHPLPEGDRFDPASRFLCEIDPHDVGQWTGMGSGATHEAALDAAKLAWRAFDQSA